MKLKRQTRYPERSTPSRGFGINVTVKASGPLIKKRKKSNNAYSFQIYFNFYSNSPGNILTMDLFLRRQTAQGTSCWKSERKLPGDEFVSYSAPKTNALSLSVTSLYIPHSGSFGKQRGSTAAPLCSWWEPPT